MKDKIIPIPTEVISRRRIVDERYNLLVREVGERKTVEQHLPTATYYYYYQKNSIMNGSFAASWDA